MQNGILNLKTALPVEKSTFLTSKGHFPIEQCR